LNEAIKDRTDRLAYVMNEIYDKFKSATHYRRIKEEVPPGAVSTELTCKWCDYTAYCDPVEGSRLLFQKELLRSELQQLNRRRNELLAPLRRTLARRKYEKALGNYRQRLAEYEVEHPRWLAAKEEWERSMPKDVVSVGGIKPSELGKVTDLAAHFQFWGA